MGSKSLPILHCGPLPTPLLSTLKQSQLDTLLVTWYRSGVSCLGEPGVRCLSSLSFPSPEEESV